MRKPEMIREILRLSSGTQSLLFGTAKYAEIDLAVALWVAWVEGQPGGARWECWQDCWSEYDLARKAVCV